jgi:hypothetical protein
MADFSRAFGIVSALSLSAAICGCASPGQLAVRQNDVAQLRQILEKPNHGGEDLSDLLDESVIFGDCVECAKLLFQNGAKAGSGPQGYKGSAGYFILQPGLNGRLAAAVWYGHAQAAKVLIEHGAEPEGALAYIRGWGADAVSVQAAKELLQKVAQESEAKVAPTQAQTEPAATKPAQWWNAAGSK